MEFFFTMEKTMVLWKNYGVLEKKLQYFSKQLSRFYDAPAIDNSATRCYYI